MARKGKLQINCALLNNSPGCPVFDVGACRHQNPRLHMAIHRFNRCWPLELQVKEPGVALTRVLLANDHVSAGYPEG